MAFIIIIFSLLVVVFSLYFTVVSAEKPNGNILLSIALPLEQMQNTDVQKIVKEFHNANEKWLIISLLFAIPIVLLIEYISLIMLYGFAYIFMLMLSSNKIFYCYYKKMGALKKQNNWFVGKTHVVSVDTQVSRLKNTFALSRLYFLPSILIAAIPFFTSNSEAFFLVLPSTSLTAIVINFLGYVLTCKDKAITYSTNTDINIALNKAYKSEWSKCWILAANGVSVINTFAFFLLVNIDNRIFIWVMAILLPFAIQLICLIVAYNKIRNIRNNLLTNENTSELTDEDDYWKTGDYNNPSDNRLFVEKRVGIGMTINMAKGASKLIYALLTAIVLFILLLIVFTFLPLDFGAMHMTIDSNSIKISAVNYSTEFSADEIVNITRLDKLPKLNKTNGASTSRVKVGHFSSKEYGKSRLYIYSKINDYILIELKNDNILLNGSTSEITQQYYNQIIALTQ